MASIIYAGELSHQEVIDFENDFNKLDFGKVRKYIQLVKVPICDHICVVLNESSYNMSILQSLLKDSDGALFDRWGDKFSTEK